MRRVIYVIYPLVELIRPAMYNEGISASENCASICLDEEEAIEKARELVFAKGVETVLVIRLAPDKQPVPLMLFGELGSSILTGGCVWKDMIGDWVLEGSNWARWALNERESERK